MKWEDLEVGMYIEGTCEDLYQVESDWTAKQAVDYEPLLDFRGVIVAINEDKLVWSGLWIWVEDYEESDEDPRTTPGIFGVRRKLIDVMKALADGRLKVVQP